MLHATSQRVRLLFGVLSLALTPSGCDTSCAELRSQVCLDDVDSMKCELLSDDERFEMLTASTCASILSALTER